VDSPDNSLTHHIVLEEQAAPVPLKHMDIEQSRAVGRPRRPLTVREVVLAWLALAVVSVFAFAPHVRHGGYYLDDWRNAAGALQLPGGSSFDHVITYFWNLTLYRPVLVLYAPLTYFAFGTHMAYQLAWAATLAVFAAAMLYGVLRTLGVSWIHTWLIAALTILYPWFDSTRLWVTGSLLTLSIGFAFAGIWLALQGLYRRSWRLHACAAVLYLMSIWTYEIALPLIAVVGGLYVAVAGWQIAKVRWGVDLIVVLIGGLWIGVNTQQESFGIGDDLRHLKEIVTSGGTILGRTLIPVGEQRTTLALIAFLVVIVAGLAMFILLRVRPGRRTTSGLRDWLLLAGGGLLIAALGWIMFIPANPYFTPSVYGVTNRVNALSGFGVVIAVYAVIGIAGEIGAGILPRTWRLAVPATVLLAILLGAAYARVLERHIRIWDAAFHAEAIGIDEMQTQFPHLASGTTVFTSAYPAYQALGVPIFSSSWDVNGMIKLRYKDGSLSAFPILTGLSIACRTNGVGLQGIGAPAVMTPYGAARFLNISSGEHAQPYNQRECQAVAGKYVPGPQYVSINY
jgi:hypothetical protein